MKAAYSLTLAPLVVKDKVIVGVGGGDTGIRGFVAAYDAKTGKELWRFYTIPGPGEPGHDTLATGDAWKTRRRLDLADRFLRSALNLTYWGVGNPGPDWNPAQRPGDNLYTASVVALDADTGTAAAGTFSSRRTTPTTTTQCRFRCWPTAAGIGARGKADALGQSQRVLLRARPRRPASSSSASRS